MIAIDKISPDEAHLPPSDRTWARVIHLRGRAVLEMRDPNDGQDRDPERKSRYQYMVVDGVLWTRRLPPAPLDEPQDETPWMRGPARWEVCDLPATRSNPITEWALDQAGEDGLRRVSPYVQHIEVERDIHGDGGGEYDAYIMPPRDPWNMWAAITSYAEGPPVPCPVHGCDQHLVWYEAGYVPGYRVCMATDADGQATETLRHRFVLDHAGEHPGMVLIREHDREDD